MAEEKRLEKGRKFILDNDRKIRSYVSKVEREILVNLQIGELYLKSGLYNEAKVRYGKIMEKTDHGGWVLLRLAEAADQLAEHEEAVAYLQKLKETLELRKEEPNEDNEALCTGAGMLAWRLGLMDIALYDLAGRLVEVKENGVVIATYRYDENGNRPT